MRRESIPQGNSGWRSKTEPVIMVLTLSRSTKKQWLLQHRPVSKFSPPAAHPGADPLPSRTNVHVHPHHHHSGLFAICLCFTPLTWIPIGANSVALFLVANYDMSPKPIIVGTAIKHPAIINGTPHHRLTLLPHDKYWQWMSSDTLWNWDTNLISFTVQLCLYIAAFCGRKFSSWMADSCALSAEQEETS